MKTGVYIAGNRRVTTTIKTLALAYAMKRGYIINFVSPRRRYGGWCIITPAIRRRK